eukprot:CAMPEP_0194492978 /NCGR_PEP_ID=MMETSP0253-20130528/11337_1 /TAXON_ID=2966 /ORGANISM="Noctiluca scintillans" /LENGTH=1015 /DNA_ID=CAMNT_0039333909 /DNA_START=28 /DNA_END=3075 /DNA_ORIENTATION=-
MSKGNPLQAPGHQMPKFGHQQGHLMPGPMPKGYSSGALGAPRSQGCLPRDSGGSFPGGNTPGERGGFRGGSGPLRQLQELASNLPYREAPCGFRPDGPQGAGNFRGFAPQLGGLQRPAAGSTSRPLQGSSGSFGKGGCGPPQTPQHPSSPPQPLQGASFGRGMDLNSLGGSGSPPRARGGGFGRVPMQEGTMSRSFRSGGSASTPGSGASSPQGLEPWMPVPVSRKGGKSGEGTFMGPRGAQSSPRSFQRGSKGHSGGGSVAGGGTGRGGMSRGGRGGGAGSSGSFNDRSGGIPRNPENASPDVAAGVEDVLLVEVWNYKSALNELVMKVTGRPVSQQDVVYSVALPSSLSCGFPQYVATVRIAVLDNVEFEGEPRSRRKEAEHSAAKTALKHLGGIVSSAGTAAVETPPTQGAAPATSTRSQTTELAGQTSNHKGQLQEYLARLGGQSRVDITYTTAVIFAGRYRSTVHVAALGEEVDFDGESCADKKEAEQSAARLALQHFAHKARTATFPPKAAAPGVPQPVPDGDGTLQSVFKSALNAWVTKAIGRPTTPQDIVYFVKMSDVNQFRAAVKVLAIDATFEFEGEVKSRKKDAEQSAAKVALRHLASLPEPSTSDERSISGSVGPPASGDATMRSASDSQADIVYDSPAGVPAPVGAVVRDEGDAVLTSSPPEETIPAPRIAPTQTPTSGNGPQAKSGNFKSALNELVMKITSRPLTSSDILYTVQTPNPGQFQATAKVVAVDDSQEFEGVPCVRKRDAEQSAAQKALHHYLAKLQGVSADVGQLPSAGASDITNFKSILNELMMRVTCRPLCASDVVYAVRLYGVGQFQATVKVTSVDGDLEFVGEVCPRKKAAEQSAARAALEHISQQRAHGALLDGAVPAGFGKERGDSSTSQKTGKGKLRVGTPLVVAPRSQSAPKAAPKAPFVVAPRVTSNCSSNACGTMTVPSDSEASCSGMLTTVNIDEPQECFPVSVASMSTFLRSPTAAGSTVSAQRSESESLSLQASMEFSAV